MELGYDDVLEILELLEHSTVDYLEIDVHGMKLVASKSGVTFQSESRLARSESSETLDTNEDRASLDSPPSHAPQGLQMHAPIGVGESPTSIVERGEETESGLVTVNAPVVGVFYWRPEPGAAPYVELGGSVSEGDTLGLLEVMKMFTGVTAPVSGEIIEILVEDGGFVEFEQPIMRIRPE